MQHRVEIADAALATFSDYSQPSGDASENIIDLITNLCHKAHSEGLDIGQILRIAGMHYDAETQEVREEMQAHMASNKKKTAKKSKRTKKPKHAK
jgi:hypothetical protein